MSYFNLRKRAPEPEPQPDLVEEDLDEAEVVDEASVKEQPTGSTNPVLLGILGPGAWIAARFGTGVAWGVHIVAVWAIGFYGGWLAVGLVAAWLLAVGVFVPREHLDRATAWIEELGEERTEEPGEPELEEPRESDPEEVYAATLEWICAQISDRNGIHISDLLNHAHAHGLHTDLDVPAFRAVLERWGFPIRQQLKVGGRNRPGIHRDDLPKLLLPGASPEMTEDATTPAEYQV